MDEPAGNRTELYIAAMKAFRDAAEVAARKPKIGSPDWQRWHDKIDEAMKLNMAYTRALQ